MKVKNLLKSGWITGKFKRNIAKQKVPNLLKSLPDNCTLEDNHETPDVCTPLELVPPDIKFKKRRN